MHGSSVRDDAGEAELSQGTWRTGVLSHDVIAVRNVPRSAAEPRRTGRSWVTSPEVLGWTRMTGGSGNRWTIVNGTCSNEALKKALADLPPNTRPAILKVALATHCMLNGMRTTLKFSQEDIDQELHCIMPRLASPHCNPWFEEFKAEIKIRPNGWMAIPSATLFKKLGLTKYTLHKKPKTLVAAKKKGFSTPATDQDLYQFYCPTIAANAIDKLWLKARTDDELARVCHELGLMIP
ncbi:hypothetical protein B0H16DRAFT_1820199 [Mycena metata]|uniref:Uncharacterized protein n=1 Tax=Mycena metata TaxID=1033252 RepID=A0AAD7MD43_9AGAR|nr:hypothetical protein B0H16DRAFT_1820199 [Mycena metata]